MFHRMFDLYMSIDMYTAVISDMCTDMCTGMCADMCMDVCISLCTTFFFRANAATARSYLAIGALHTTVGGYSRGAL